MRFAEGVVVIFLHHVSADVGPEDAMSPRIVLMEAILARDDVEGNLKLIDPIPLHIEAGRTPDTVSLLNQVPALVIHVCGRGAKITEPPLHTSAQMIPP